MNVVSHGSKVTEHKCLSCGCVFEYADEGIMTCSKGRMNYLAVRCPECNSYDIVNNEHKETDNADSE